MRMTATAARRLPERIEPAPTTKTVRTERLKRLLAPVLVVNILALPLLIPRGIGNTAPPDLVMIPFTVLGASALWRLRSRIRLPLGGLYLLILLGGILAVTQSIVPKRSTLALLEDGYLFVWFIVTLNLLRDGTGRMAELVARAWVVAGVATAAVTSLLRFTFPAHIPRVFGYQTVSPFGRVSATFEDPNLAGNYLVVSLFVLWASPWPRTRKVKLVLTLPFLLGIWNTQSITALATVAGGTTAAVLTSYVRRRSHGIPVAIALVGVILFGATFLPADLGYRASQVAQSLGKSTVTQGSVGRSQKSLGTRLERIQEAFRFFGSDILIGIGPSATSTTLAASNAPIGGEIHDDYAAGFLERGIVGGIGVIGLFLAALWWSFKTGSDRTLRTAGWHPAALTGATVAILMAAFSLETLHFRHVWALFALMIGLALGHPSEPVPRAGSLGPGYTARTSRSSNETDFGESE